MEADTYDTIVVGLGSAGATAASTLARAGRRVLALEAQDRIGGRVRSVPFADGLVELGAEWIHGQYPSRVYDLAVKNNITVVPQEMDFEVFRSDGSVADQQLVNELVLYCLSVLEDPPEEPESIGSLVTRRLLDYVKERKPELLKDQDFIEQFLEFMNLYINNYEASNDWNDVSTFSKYEELRGHQHVSWHRHGYKTFFELVLNTYNNGSGLPTLDIKLNKEVSQVRWPHDPSALVVVTCADGTVYAAASVIVTVSLGVLKERHTTLFSPPLPQDKVTIIEKMSMGVMDKVILSFDKPWWPKNVTFFGFMWKGEEKRQVSEEDRWTTKIFGASRPMGAQHALTLWTSGDTAKQVEQLPEDVVKRKCVDLLRKFMGTNFEVPEPAAIIRSAWYTNRFTRGSYTYDNHAVVAHPGARSTLARPLLDGAGAPRVLFAGEATHDAHFSTVHGASDTGRREAARLLPHSKL